MLCVQKGRWEWIHIAHHDNCCGNPARVDSPSSAGYFSPFLFSFSRKTKRLKQKPQGWDTPLGRGVQTPAPAARQARRTDSPPPASRRPGFQSGRGVPPEERQGAADAPPRRSHQSPAPPRGPVPLGLPVTIRACAPQRGQ